VILALDYDDTFTADPILWEHFINKVKERGHSVTFVTSRGYHHSNDYNADIKQDAKRLNIDIVFCFGESKAAKFKADVWIDDTPLAIPTDDAVLTRASLLKFKGINAKAPRKPSKGRSRMALLP
jgi:hypothetical protein